MKPKLCMNNHFFLAQSEIEDGLCHRTHLIYNPITQIVLIIYSKTQVVRIILGNILSFELHVYRKIHSFSLKKIYLKSHTLYG